MVQLMNAITPEHAQSLHRSGQLEAAESAYRQLIGRFPTRLDIALALTYLLRDQGRRSAAAQIIVGWWNRSERDRVNGIRVVTLLTEMDRTAAAKPVIGHLVQHWPEDPAVLEQAAMVAQGSGEFDQARSYLLAALQSDPARPGAWLRLAHGRKFSNSDDPDLVAIRKRLQKKLPPAQEIALQFAVGKIQDDLGDHEAASRAWKRGNALAVKSSPQSSQTIPDIPAWNVADWPRLRPQNDGQRPVFIVGMPRSGTTLLARQLARLHGVRDRGELNWLGLLLKQLPPRPDLATLESVRHLFLAQLLQDDAPASWYIDQNPRNFQYIQPLHHLFPDAKVIHIKRQPADVALSIWSQLFAHPEMNWSHRFESIREEFERYLEIAQTFPETENCISLGYEQLVQEPDRILADLAETLGVEAGETPEVPENIATASLWQARQPVHARSLNRWKQYVEFIPELSSFTRMNQP